MKIKKSILTKITFSLNINHFLLGSRIQFLCVLKTIIRKSLYNLPLSKNYLYFDKVFFLVNKKLSTKF